MWFSLLIACVREPAPPQTPVGAPAPEDSAEPLVTEREEELIWTTSCFEGPGLLGQEGLGFQFDVRVEGPHGGGGGNGPAWLEIWSEGPAQVELHDFPAQVSSVFTFPGLNGAETAVVYTRELYLLPALTWTAGETTRMDNCGTGGGTSEETVVFNFWQADRFDCVVNGPQADWISAERGCRVDPWGWQDQ